MMIIVFSIRGMTRRIDAHLWDSMFDYCNKDKALVRMVPES